MRATFDMCPRDPDEYDHLEHDFGLTAQAEIIIALRENNRPRYNLLTDIIILDMAMEELQGAHSYYNTYHKKVVVQLKDPVDDIASVKTMSTLVIAASCTSLPASLAADTTVPAFAEESNTSTSFPTSRSHSGLTAQTLWPDACATTRALVLPPHLRDALGVVQDGTGAAACEASKA